MRVRIYTDGACSVNPGPGGWAIVVNTDTSCEQFSGNEKHTTNNRMELMGFAAAMDYIVQHENANDTFEVFCDSAYVVNSINAQWLTRWKLNGWKTKQGDDIKNRDLWENIDKFLVSIRKQGKRVNIVKVKGHSGNTFNELVDKVARAESMKAKEGAV